MILQNSQFEISKGKQHWNAKIQGLGKGSIPFKFVLYRFLKLP